MTISKLAPREMPRHSGLDVHVRELAIHAGVTMSGDFLSELYLAGVWHGAETTREMLGITRAEMAELIASKRTKETT